MNVEHYFATARERETIRRRRLRGEPRPWTADPIFQNYRFTNVHRENDKTTRWFRENVRDPLGFLVERYRLSNAFPDQVYHQARIKLVESTVIFRWFNKIETAQIVKDLLLENWNPIEAELRLQNVSPIVTGAYMVHSPYGYSKLQGLLKAIEWARPRLAEMVPKWLGNESQEKAHADLCTLENMGSFSAGEVIWDLRWTPILYEANDIFTWTIAGPGCARGLGYVESDDPNKFRYSSKSDQRVMLAMMQEILIMSRKDEYWPSDWEPWELHEAEMWACEYAKYRSAQAGGRLKRRF